LKEKKRKSKKEKKNKYEHPTGHFIKEEIYNFILEEGLRKGVKAGIISKHVCFGGKPISRTTRALHLRELEQSKRIYKKKW
jgi:hypothetical protein